MSLTRRRLFQRLTTLDQPTHPEWISARGREAGMIEYGDQGMAAGARPIRIASNENPLGPGSTCSMPLSASSPKLLATRSTPGRTTAR